MEVVVPKLKAYPLLPTPGLWYQRVAATRAGEKVIWFRSYGTDHKISVTTLMVGSTCGERTISMLELLLEGLLKVNMI